MPTILTLFQTVLRKLQPAEVDQNFLNLRDTADAAKTAADSVAGTANNALTAANTANTNASNALTIANAADDKADSALAALAANTGALNVTAVGATVAGVGTYNKQFGSYAVDKNNWVDFTLTLGWTAHTGTGAIKINGLPFPSANDGEYYAVSAYYETFTVGSSKQLTALIFPNSTSIALYANDPAGGSSPTLNVDTAVSWLVLTGRYKKA